MPLDASTSTIILVVTVAVLALILGIGAAVLSHRKRTARLRTRFGPEYERVLLEKGSERKAHTQLISRENRVRQLRLVDIDPSQRERFLDEWASIQSRFLDHPRIALIEADELVTQLLQARGYPAGGFEESAENLSVHFPRLTENYRFAHTVAVRSESGQASTEELRTAILQFRALFDEFVMPVVNEVAKTAA